MTAPQNRFSIPRMLQDHHTRIRRLEASPSGGGSGSCPDCVLDPFTVNPNDISVPDPYRSCVDVSAHAVSEPVAQCGTGNVFIVSSIPIGFCSAYGLGTPLGLQLRAKVAFAPCVIDSFGPTANVANLILYAGNPEAQVDAWTWDVAGTPQQSPCDFDTGWVDIDALCGGSCAALTASMSFQSHSSFTGGCATGVLAGRWVVLNEDGDYRGALDDLPQGQAESDVIHFNSTTHEFVIGPGSVPSRAISTFMGGR